MERLCKICTKQLTKKQLMYCSKSCGAKGTQSWKVRSKQYKDYYCKNCGGTHHRKNISFCSDKCKIEHKKNKMIMCFTKQYIGTSSFQRLKKYLIILGYADDRCNKCGISEWCESPITLQLHHIDGDNKNNSIKNLEILCPNCHAQTENYVGRNKRVISLTV